MNRIKNYVRISLVITIYMTLVMWLFTIIKGEMPRVDQWTRKYIDSVTYSIVYKFFRWITELGSDTFLIPFTILMSFLLLWLFRDWFPAFIFASGTLMSHLLNMFIKIMIARERPSISIEANAEGYSFPSGHAMISMVCYGLLMYFLGKKLSSKKSIILTQIIFSLLIFLIGISRFVINVHYITDILFGFGVGYLLLICLIYCFEGVQRYRFS